MGKIANKQMICEVLMEAAKTDKNIVALCSDSRGSGSFTPFADTYPEQFVETGIAEQNLVSISAGLAKSIRSFSGMFLIYKKLRAVQSRCSLFKYKCKINRYQRRCQLWCTRNESPFCTGYCSYECNPKYESISSK